MHNFKVRRYTKKVLDSYILVSISIGRYEDERLKEWKSVADEHIKIL